MRAVRLLGSAFAFTALSCAPRAAEPPASPEGRAIRFLAREVPEWPQKNKCFSCHNNGDAARALFAARRSSLPVDPAALETTARWLLHPDAWKDNGPKVEYSDKRLASLQFAHALSAAAEAGEAGAKEALLPAAAQVRDLQEADGSLSVDADGLPGSPVTYGRTLATVVALRIFEAARLADAAQRAERWLRTLKPVGVLDAAALLLSRRGNADDCLALLRKGQSRDGGWGPHVNSPPENFDTALALLGLAGVSEGPGVADMIRRGRAFLVDAQRRDGSWPETTRPPGAESYAQRISTTGWATLALLATAPARRAD